MAFIEFFICAPKKLVPFEPEYKFAPKGTQIILFYAVLHVALHTKLLFTRPDDSIVAVLIGFVSKDG